MKIERHAAPVRALVAEALRDAIADQRFKPGERLRERELCELTGVSRTSVREALRQLESEGLVEVTTQGPIVARITKEDARELYAVRSVLEGLAGRLAATRATPQHVAALRDVIEGLEEALTTGVYDSLVAQKDEFYQLLIRIAGNREVGRMLTGLRARVNFLRATSLSEPDRLARTISELHAVVDAIAQHEPDNAERACQAHVENAADVALKILRDR